jgi:hypothetical protein
MVHDHTHVNSLADLIHLPYILQDALVNEPGQYLPAIVSALVAALERESPFCVAAAAGALHWIGCFNKGGQKLIESSGAIPALLGVIKTGISAANFEDQTALFRRYAPNAHLAMAWCIPLQSYACFCG